MDNEAFRTTYRAVNERFCPYEKAILTNQCCCSRAKRFLIAERESSVDDPAAHQPGSEGPLTEKRIRATRQRLEKLLCATG